MSSKYWAYNDMVNDSECHPGGCDYCWLVERCEAEREAELEEGREEEDDAHQGVD